MSAAIVRFPTRHVACVWLIREEFAWLVLACGSGWVHGDFDTALADARWLARNLGIAIRAPFEAAPLDLIAGQRS